MKAPTAYSPSWTAITSAAIVVGTVIVMLELAFLVPPVPCNPLDQPGPRIEGLGRVWGCQ